MTLIEILIAVTFLAVCAVAILETVLTADTQSSYALRRAQVVSALQDQIEVARGNALAGTIAASTGTTTLAITGIAGPVTVTTAITQHANSRTLWDISVVGTWSEQRGSRVWNDTASIASLIKQ